MTALPLHRTIPLAYGSLLLILALYKAREFWKLNGFSGSRLVLVLIRVQALYYFMCVSTAFSLSKLIAFNSALFCLLAKLLNDLAGSSLIVSALLSGLGSPTLLSVTGSRMFFNLKEAAEHGINVGTNWSSYSHSAIRFDEPGPQNSEGQCVSPHFPLNHCIERRT